MKRSCSPRMLPPSQAGVSDALRRAFAPADDGAASEFDALLRKLA